MAELKLLVICGPVAKVNEIAIQQADSEKIRTAFESVPEKALLGKALQGL